MLVGSVPLSAVSGALFNSSSHALTLPLGVGGASLTLTMTYTWSPVANPTYGAVLASQAGNFGAIHLLVNADGYVGVFSNSYAPSTARLTRGAATHISLVSDGGLFRLFVGGALALRTQGFNTLSSPVTMIGNFLEGSSLYAQGFIRDVAIHGVAFSDAAVARLHAAGAGSAIMRAPSATGSASSSATGTGSASTTGPRTRAASSASGTRSAAATRTPAATRSPTPTPPICLGLSAMTSVAGTAGVAPRLSTSISGQPGMYTAGTCAAGLSTLYPGSRLLYALDLGSTTPLGGTLTLTTCGHTADDTVLYVGTGCPTWAQPFACKAGNDNAAGAAACGGNSLASTVAVVATQSSYFVQLGGVNGAHVTSGLAWSYALPSRSPSGAAATRSRTATPTRTRTATKTRTRSATKTRSRTATPSRSKKAKLV